MQTDNILIKAIETVTAKKPVTHDIYRCINLLRIHGTISNYFAHSFNIMIREKEWESIESTLYDMIDYPKHFC